MSDRRRTLLYLHIPRTAGGSIRAALTAVCRPEECQLLYDPSQVPGATEPGSFASLPESVRARPRVVIGEFSYGLHEHVPSPSRYVTTIRNPLGRVLSMYRAGVDGADASAEQPSILEWLDHVQPVGANNGMVRLIAGGDARPFGDCPDDMLQEALEHVEASFDAVMVLGRMTEARRTLTRLVGVEVPPLGRVNAGTERSLPGSLDGRARDRLAELNRLDVAFFRKLAEREAESVASVHAVSEPRASTKPLPSAAARPRRLRAARHAHDIAVGDRTLLFMHIAKTGGTSLRRSLSRAYADHERVFIYDPADLRLAVRQDEFGELSAERRIGLRLVMGHFRYGLHKGLGRPFRYITVIRDPVERVVSLYYHYLHLRRMWLRRLPIPGVRRAGDAREEQARILREEISLEDWVFGQRRLAVDNGMTRNIAARAGLRFGDCPDDLLDEAVVHIDRDFATVLVTDELDTSGPVIERITGRALPSVPRTNVNRKRPALDSIDPHVLARLRELNRLDVQLYEMAKDISRSRGAVA